MRKFLATITIASIGVTAGATASSAHTPSHAVHCGVGIDPTVVLRHGEWVNAWSWQYNDHAPIVTKRGTVGVWTNRHGGVVGYAAYEDTNIMPSANCAAKDI